MQNADFVQFAAWFAVHTSDVDANEGEVANGKDRIGNDSSVDPVQDEVHTSSSAHEGEEKATIPQSRDSIPCALTMDYKCNKNGKHRNSKKKPKKIPSTGDHCKKSH